MNPNNLQRPPPAYTLGAGMFAQTGLNAPKPQSQPTNNFQ